MYLVMVNICLFLDSENIGFHFQTHLYTRVLCHAVNSALPTVPPKSGARNQWPLQRAHADCGARKALLRTDEFRKLQKKFVYLNSTCFSNPESKMC